MSTSRQLRNDIALLVREAGLDLAALWNNAKTPSEVETVLRDVLPGLIDDYGAAASTVSADWYDDLRASVQVRGAFTATPAAIADSGTQALVGWALEHAQDFDSFKQLILGGTQRRITNYSRQTVIRSSTHDPRATGWQRVGSGECAFCAMLIGRGAVYTEAGADFASHDWCNCGAEPAWGGLPVPVKPYTPSRRNISDADRARVREWIASH